FYSAAFVSTFLRRTPRFDVTPKGGSGEPDRAWQSFRKHWFWAAVSTAAIAGAIAVHHTYPANLVWAVRGLVTSVLPFTIWSAGRVTRRLGLALPAGPEISRPSWAAVTMTEAARAESDAG